MTTITRRQTAAFSVLALGSIVMAHGLANVVATPQISDLGQVLAQQDRVLTDKEIVGGSEIGGPGRPPILEGPPIKIPPIKERLPHANEGVGNGVDGDTPGHQHNGANDDGQFSPGNPGAKSK